MANVMQMRNLKNKPSRNGFDLSESRKQTSKVGEMVPVFCKTIMPGDHVELYPQHFTRTVPLNTAAYVRIKEEVNFFKVPFHLLWNRFDTFITEMKNNPQHAADFRRGVSIPDLVPTLSRELIAKTLYVNRTVADELTYNYSKQSVKLLQYLGYGDFDSFTVRDWNGYDRNRSFSPFPLLAYQKVYQDYYRNQQWEKAAPQSFNIDYADGPITFSPQGLSTSELINSMFTLRYANFKKDYFFGLLPSPQYGDSSVVPVIKSSPDDGINVFSNGSPSTSGTIFGYTANVGSFINNPSVLSIRKAEAIQKLREIQQSGKQDYKEQIEKIFGVSMSDDKSDLCTWLGGYDSDININEVVNNNLTGDSVADIQGKATSNGNGKIVFDSDDWCILIGVYTAIPILDFQLSAPDYDTLLVHRDHYPNPVMDRIGMEEMLLTELIGDTVGDKALSNTEILGYGPRYFRFKTSFDKVLGGFRYPDAYNNWVAPINVQYLLEKLLTTDNNYVPSYRLFKVDPKIMNNVLTVNITQPFSMSGFQYDQLLTNFDIQCAMVRNLDYDGLPY